MPVQVQGQEGIGLAVASLGSLGRPALVAALAFAVAAGGCFALGAFRRRASFVDAGRRATAAAALFTGAAVVAMVTALLAKDFSFEYVAGHTSRSLSGAYSVAALWGGMEGSLLLWTFLLTTFAVAGVYSRKIRGTKLLGCSGAVLSAVSVFFLALLLMPADPFTELARPPADGRGLNPLLQSPGMVIHPPLLYMGFVGFSIPFAFAIGALLSNRLDDAWFTSTRRWTLFAWSALSIGIVLGGAWAYTELGWGGYWAWDPVENASFMPWLTATAFLHSVVIQEKRRMLKVWNVSLILLTYGLAVFGTFLTRSGLLSSIHTFTEGPIGKWFLPFLALILVGGFAAVAWRMDSLRSENRLDSPISREAAFLANNVLFLAAALTVLWGTIYPVVAEAFTGVRLSVGPPFFNSVFIPIALAIIGLTGLGPLISWRRTSRGVLKRMLRLPLAAGASVAAALGALGVRSTGALLAFSLCAFTATAVAGEFYRGSRVHRRREGSSWPRALARTVGRNRRRYGGYVVHLGVVLIVIGLAGAAFSIERATALRPGESMRIGDYELTFEGIDQRDTPEKRINQANVSVARDGDRIARLGPQRNFHVAQQQAQSEVAIRTTPVEDLYVVVTGFQADGSALIRAFVNPLTWWIWMGTAVMAAGMTILLGAPGPATATVRAARRAPEAAAVAGR